MRFVVLSCCVCLLPLLGCTVLPPLGGHRAQALPPVDMPRELAKVALPTYRVEPPDILVIEAIHIVPRSPYGLRGGDVIAINVQNTLPEAPIAGAFQIQSGGVVNLGPPYGQIKVGGMTLQRAEQELDRFLRAHPTAALSEPVVSATLVEMTGGQQIAGQHLVGPDGMVTLGSYGSVPVVGLTLQETKQAIEAHLANFLDEPEVAVDVFAYNSMVYYVITPGAGAGDGVTKFPITGNETVLDALANINGLSATSSKRIWIARPDPCLDQAQILPVDWFAITSQGSAITNYQIMPGDRIFVAEDKLIAFDTNLAKILAPLERAMGFTLLTAGTATRLSGNVLEGGGNPGGGGGGGGGGGF